MKRTLLACALGSLLCCGPAAAGPEAGQEQEQPAQIHVNAIRKPEIRKYKALLAGLDSFDKHHALAPGAPALQFRVRPAGGRNVTVPAGPLRVRLEGDDEFRLPLVLDAESLFTVPRDEAALNANSEVALNQRRSDYRIVPHVRTPGLPDNVRRLGDLRLECKAAVAIAKEEISLVWVLAINGLLRTRDWCSFTMENESLKWGVDSDRSLVGATLSEGGRTQVLETSHHRFEVPLHESHWSNDALVTLDFGDAPATAQESGTATVATNLAATGTAAGTPRTAP